MVVSISSQRHSPIQKYTIVALDTVLTQFQSDLIVVRAIMIYIYNIYIYVNKEKNSRDAFIIYVEVSGICDACVFGVCACGVETIQNSTDEPVIA